MSALSQCEAGVSCTQMPAWCGACDRVAVQFARGQPLACPGIRKPEAVPSHPFQGPLQGPENYVYSAMASGEGAL